MPLIENLCDDCLFSGKVYSRIFSYPERPFPLPFELRSAGYHLISSTAYNWDGLQRQGESEMLIQLTLSGRGALEFGGKTCAVPPGFAMMLCFPEANRYFLPADSDHWEVLYANFGGSEAKRLLLELRKRFGPVIPMRKESESAVLLEKLVTAPPPGSVWEAADAAYHFLMTMAMETERHDEKNPRPSFLDRALDYCRAHPEGDLSVETLARQAGYSRWYFSREFKRCLGASVPRYVTELRLKLADELLQSTRLSIKETAARCGFEDTSYFIKVYSKYRHRTPGEFRTR